MLACEGRLQLPHRVRVSLVSFLLMVTKSSFLLVCPSASVSSLDLPMSWRTKIDAFVAANLLVTLTNFINGLL